MSRRLTEVSEIRILEPSVVSKIAAGEVVERPASAIKELVENSIDSGATEIRVKAEGGGITSLSVSDDGHGMSADGIRMSVQPHATSKLRVLGDLDEIDTLGFRGEALAAITSLSNTTVRSRQHDAKDGHELKLSGNWEGEEPVPCVMSPGTEIVVRDIFIHAPARRKFLRRPQTEWAHCEVAMQVFAIGNPGIGFLVERDGKKRNHWEPQEERERVHAVLGSNFASGASEFNHQRGPLSVHGYIDVNGTGTKSRQFMYLNGRPINDKLIRQAVRKAFVDVLRGSEYPYVMFLTVPKKMVDVNAHPAKLEVRFKEPSAIFSFVNAAVGTVANQPLGSNPSITIEYQSASAGRGYKPKSASERALDDMFRNTRNKRDSNDDDASGQASGPTASPGIAPLPATGNEVEGDDQEPPKDLGRVVGLLHGIYLLSETENGLMVIDVHAAHERIIYEDLKDKNEVKAQDLIAPVELDLSPVAMDAVQEHRGLLAKAGLRVENVGGVESLMSVPSLLADKLDDPAVLVGECIDEIAECGGSFAAEELCNKVLATVACHAAVRGSNPFLGDMSLDSLLRKMEVTLRSGKCNHGRPCWRLISMTSLDRSFERGR